MHEINLIILTIFVKTCLTIPALLYLNPSNELIKNNDACTDTKTGKRLLIGESVYSHNKCTQKQCIWGPTLWEYECNVPKFTLTDGECYQISQKDPFQLNYPKCCPRYECKKYSGTNYYEQNTFNHYGNLLSKSVVQIFTITQHPSNITSLNAANTTRTKNII